MVVGAGRGPLVRSTINASRNVQRKIKIFVIEKNPNAIVTLSALKEEMWPNEGLCTRISSKFSHQKLIAFFSLENRFDDYLIGYA